MDLVVFQGSKIADRICRYVHCGITKVKGDGFYPIPHIMFNDSMISSSPSTSTGRGPPSNARVSPRAIVSAALSPRVLIAVLHKQSWFASAASAHKITLYFNIIRQGD